MAEWIKEPNGDYNRDYVVLEGDEARNLVRHFAATLSGPAWTEYRNATRAFTFDNPEWAEMLENYLEEGEALRPRRDARQSYCAMMTRRTPSPAAPSTSSTGT